MRTTRTTTLALAGLLIAATATGCGSAVTTSSAGTKANDFYAQIAGLPKDQQVAKAEAVARQEGNTLSLYTSMTSDVATPVTQAFEKKYGIKVNVFRGTSETVLQRTLQEVQAGKAGADALETNFAELMALADNNFLADFNGAALDKVDSTAKFPQWTATRLNVFQPAWNTDLIKPADEPHSWEDLALPKYRGKLTLEISDSDWYANVTKYWLDHGKSQAEVDSLWQDIAANSKVAKGHVTMMQFLSAGQSAIQAMNYTYITDHAIAAGAPVTHLPRSGVSKIPAFPRPNGVAMVKNAQRPASAWLFYHFMLTDGQKELVKLKLTPSTKVPGDKSLQGITLVPFDVEGVSRDAAHWDKKYDALLRSAGKSGK